MFSAKERLLFVIPALVSAAIGLAIAGYAVSGQFRLGDWDPNAWYQSYINGRPISVFSGERVISTNNGMLGLCVTPFLVTALLLLVLGIVNKSIPRQILGRRLAGACPRLPGLRHSLCEHPLRQLGRYICS